MGRIVHVISKMVIGGVEVGALSLLVNRGDSDYHLLCIRGGEEEILSSLDEGSRSRVYLCNGYFDALVYLFKLKPKYLITSLWSSHLVGMFYSLFTSKARYHFVHSTNYAHLIDRLITKLSIKTAKSIITDSEKTKEFVGATSKKVFVAPMNISFLDYSPKCFNNLLNFVFIGRFNKVKNIKESIDFIAYIRAKGLDATLDLYGRDDGVQQNLESYIFKLGLSKNITFKGVVEPLMAEKVMRRYDFYLQTSVYEGMSISVFQSLINGLIPIVTPVGEIPNYSSHKVNAFHLDLNNKIASYNEFISMYKNNFKGLKIGVVSEPNKYPLFYISFFEIFRDC
jgi:glycosyltransferase involved in cell wall biosynthesis